ncbi:MAG: cytochrome c family protein [Gemmataceae bacterium]|nr:cytochrome c family protein [Gemmataceae bacterium]
MTDTSARWKLGAALACAAMGAAWLVLPAAQGADEKKDKEEEAPRELKWRPKGKKPNSPKAYYAVESCAGCCHGDGKPLPFTKGKALCRCDESTRWKQEDRHGYAFKALTEPRGTAMGELLSYGKDPKTWDKCITCHAVKIDKGADTFVSDDFKLEDGVSCVACHGEYTKWFENHQLESKWKKFRPLPREEKWKEHGMRDLWDPAERAKLCASCHVGNQEEGKFVTHDMYAAGHPPLPSLEMGAYTRGMKYHWQYLREKNPKVAAEQGYKGTKDKKDDLEEIQVVLVGAAVSLREAMALLIQAPLDEGALDWSHFDCQACHHDLKSPSWRQEAYKGRKVKPGRVAYKGWSPELVRLAIAALDDGDKQKEQFEKRLAALQAAFTKKAFGDIAKVREAANSLGEFANEVAVALNRPKKHFTATEAKALLKKYPTVFETKTRLFDFDSSRQIAWSFLTIHDELHDVEALEGGKDAIAKVRKELNDALRLDMTKMVKVDGKEEYRLEQLEVGYKEKAERAAAHDGKAARKLLEKLWPFAE